MDVRGGLVEWLCSGLQIRVHRFDSGTRLHELSQLCHFYDIFCHFYDILCHVHVGDELTLQSVIFTNKSSTSFFV